MLVTLADWKPTERQIKLVNQVLKSGRLTYGSMTKELEEKFAKKHNFKYCIFTNSGTSALEVVWAYLKEINRWPDGSEVIVPAVTFVATVNVLLHNRLKPVLVDIDPPSFCAFNINSYLINEKITPKTVAICPVDLLGRPVDIEPIKKIARKNNLKIVEDSCEAMFVNYPNGKPVGSEADIAVYSSYLAHIISTGVGGFLCTNNEKWASDMRSMIWHGRDNYYLSIDDNIKNKKKLLKTRFRFNRPGYSFRLTELEAAIGIDEVDRSGEIIKKRKENATYLYELLVSFTGIGKEGYIYLHEMRQDNAWMFFPIVCKNKVNRDEFCLYLEKRGIQTRTIMPLLHQPVFNTLWRDHKTYPVAEWVNKQGFLLGIHQFLKKNQLEYIAKCFHEFYEKENFNNRK